MSSRQPHEDVWALTTSGYVARCMQVVAELGVADHISDQPVGISELAAQCAVDEDALDRVLQMLVAHGVFAGQAGAYGHTPASRLLRSDHPTTMRPFVQMMGLPPMWGSLTNLRQAVQTGRPSIEFLEGGSLWAYFGAHPEEAEIFGRAMTAKAAAEVAAVLQAYDFHPFASVADIGGGRGHLLSAVLESVPTAEGVLFDLPDVIKSLEVSHPRLTAQAGDFFADPLPEADAYVLMEILHDWADKECVAILSAVRRAARDSSTLLIIEGVLAEDRVDPRARTLDLVMLTATGGRERTAEEMAALLQRGGFRVDRVVDTASPMRIVEASPV